MSASAEPIVTQVIHGGRVGTLWMNLNWFRRCLQLTDGRLLRSPLASADPRRSPLARLLLLVLMELVLLLLLLGEDMDGRLWLRKTPGAMGCGPPDFTVPVLNSWSVRLPSWESRLCSGELLSWDLGSSITIAFFLVLFFFFLVFCCSSFWNKFLSRWDNTNRNRIYTHGTFPLRTWCESFAAAAASPVSMEATRAPSLAGRSCRGTDGPTRAATTSTHGVRACYSN